MNKLYSGSEAKWKIVDVNNCKLEENREVITLYLFNNASR